MHFTECSPQWPAYRFAAGELPVVEGLIVPLLMVICDGFLLAWLVVELRNAGFDDTGEDRLDARQAIVLMPAAVLIMPLRCRLGT